MKNTPRVPWGYTRRILASLQYGDTAIVRPEYINAFRVISEKMGVRFVANSFWNGIGERRIRITRVRKNDWITGHIRQRMPVRDMAGHFVKDAA